VAATKEQTKSGNFTGSFFAMTKKLVNVFEKGEQTFSAMQSIPPEKIGRTNAFLDRMEKERRARYTSMNRYRY
jgi:hypothetical protein